MTPYEASNNLEMIMDKWQDEAREKFNKLFGCRVLVGDKQYIVIAVNFIPKCNEQGSLNTCFSFDTFEATITQTCYVVFTLFSSFTDFINVELTELKKLMI